MIAHLAAALDSPKLATRQEAVEELLDAAEEGADLTPALGALGRALSDVDGEVRECAGEILGYWTRAGGAPGDAVPGLVGALGDSDVALVAGECLRDALDGPDAPAVLAALEGGLDGVPLLSRNAAGLLARGWLHSDDPGRAARLLIDDRPLIREGACEAAVTAVRAGRDVATLAGVFDGLLEDTEAAGVARRAAWLLTRVVPDRLPGLLTHIRSEVRFGALAALAEACDAGVMPPDCGVAIQGCLTDPVPDIRQKAAYVFAAQARAGMVLDQSVPALGAALCDPAPDVRHEAVLALLWLARSGQDISAASIPGILQSGGVRLRRTAAMAWGRHLLNRGESDAATALLEEPDRHVRFGAAWGMTERHLARHDVSAILDLLQHPDRLIAEAVVSTMRQHREEGRNVSAGLTAIHLLQQGGLMDSARAHGLFAEFLR